ncbi:hypothetical protein [Paenibacillus sp. Soil750]|uniref:hypothetical protein n=1 Tax=Paenibacillus sp. Soil750 TaxID=1736398 RepID=UPI0006F3456A|nr:hypothetical protein [Paenibacillus sp. Soil750]KRE70773.1 hypothetical protein ASL11_10790 [Paenibacillus sp. Soil750]
MSELEDEKQNKQLSARISEGVMLGVLTLIGYFCAYKFEVGNLAYYNIPDNFVEVELISVLNVVSVIWPNLIPLFYLVISLEDAFSFKTNTVKGFAFITSFICILYLGMLFFSGFNWVTTIVMLIFEIFLIIFTFIIPLFKEKSTTGYWNKVENYKPNLTVPPFFLRIINDYGKRTALMIVVAISTLSFLPLFSDLGKREAEREDTYLIATLDGQQKVLIGTYMDSMIIAPVDVASKEITPKFQFIKQKDDDVSKILAFESVKTGPLKVREPRSVNESVYE